MTSRRTQMRRWVGCNAARTLLPQQAYVTAYNKAAEQLEEAEHKNDVAKIIQLQPALKFNGGGGPGRCGRGASPSARGGCECARACGSPLPSPPPPTSCRAGHINHSLFWKMLTPPKVGGLPGGHTHLKCIASVVLLGHTGGLRACPLTLRPAHVLQDFEAPSGALEQAIEVRPQQQQVMFRKRREFVYLQVGTARALRASLCAPAPAPCTGRVWGAGRAHLQVQRQGGGGAGGASVHRAQSSGRLTGEGQATGCTAGGGGELLVLVQTLTIPGLAPCRAPAGAGWPTAPR